MAEVLISEKKTELLRSLIGQASCSISRQSTESPTMKSTSPTREGKSRSRKSKNSREHFAESVFFQSPDPSSIPLPDFEEVSFFDLR